MDFKSSVGRGRVGRQDGRDRGQAGQVPGAVRVRRAGDAAHGRRWLGQRVDSEGLTGLEVQAYLDGEAGVGLEPLIAAVICCGHRGDDS